MRFIFPSSIGLRRLLFPSCSSYFGESVRELKVYGCRDRGIHNSVQGFEVCHSHKLHKALPAAFADQSDAQQRHGVRVKQE